MTTIDRSHIRVKAMLIAPNDDFTAHAVSLNPPTKETPDGYHRLIGGGVEHGESHRDAMVREVNEELGVTIRDLTFLTTVESIFRIPRLPTPPSLRSMAAWCPSCGVRSATNRSRFPCLPARPSLGCAASRTGGTRASARDAGRRAPGRQGLVE